jgi:predicted SnoaL-like aldol condensation-catalyzing enzyme
MSARTGQDFVDRYYDLLGAGDVDGIAALYGDGGEVIRYDGVAADPDQIRGYFVGFLQRHPGCSLRSVDQIREADDVLMWDALVDTDNGLLQSVHVVLFDDDGKVRRHIPGIRGYWGQ